MSNNTTHDYKITNIRAGKGNRSHILYACLCDGDRLLISATLDYITERLKGMLCSESDEDYRSRLLKAIPRGATYTAEDIGNDSGKDLDAIGERYSCPRK